MPSNCGAGKDSLDSKEIKLVNLKGNQPWILLKLKLQYFGHLMQTDDSLEKPRSWEKLKAEEEGVRGLWCTLLPSSIFPSIRVFFNELAVRRWDGWMVSPKQWTWTWTNWETVRDREVWHAIAHGVTKSLVCPAGQLNNN